MRIYIKRHYTKDDSILLEATKYPIIGTCFILDISDAVFAQRAIDATKKFLEMQTQLADFIDGVFKADKK